MQEIIGYENNEGKVKYTKDGIEYNLEKPDVIIAGGGVIGGQYSYDNNDINAEPGSPVINAVDIAWNAHLPISGATIDTTTDLLKHLDAKQSSIPILDNYSIENSDSLPDKYIGIRSERDLISNDTNYLSILFSAIRSLQAEVAKLRNSFKYGINSYNDTNTALGNVITEYSEDQDEEPLWAVDEEDLSIIREFDFPLDNRLLVPSENVKTFTDYIEILDYAQFTNNNSITALSTIEDPKIFLYFTTANLNIIINFKNRTDENDIISINLSSLTDKNFASEKYDIMLCLSKQVHENLNDITSKLVSSNYIYISIGEYLFGKTYLEGYYNGSTLQKNPVYTFNDIYDINSIEFGNNKIWKLNAYSKEQDFSKEVIPSTPSDNDYKYGVAHITIRSVKTKDILDSIKDKLQENELIFVESTNRLYIKSKGDIINIGASGGEEHPGQNDNMTKEQLIESLRDLGIIVIEGTDDNGNPINDINIDNIQNINVSNININSTSDDNQININSGTSTINMANIGSITLINEDTGKKFTLSIDAYGNLKTDEIVLKELYSLNKDKQRELIGENLVEANISNINSDRNNLPYKYRGFHSLFNICNYQAKNNIKIDGDDDVKLNADRIKISAIYAPLATDKIHGCTHAFIELENTSDKEFPLDGVYLHYGKLRSKIVTTEHIVDENYSKMYHLALTGSIKPNSTYLIRCKKYAEPTDVNTYINVDTYDQEWYDNGNLLDLSQYNTKDDGYTYKYGFALTYTDFKIYDENDNIIGSLKDNLKNIDWNDKFLIPTTGTATEYKIRCDFIDCISINGIFGNWDICNSLADTKNKVVYADNSFFKQRSNSIYRNTFALDPAKQAFNSLNNKDSSRCRHANSKTDLNTLSLDKEYISFPKSGLVKKISDYKPRASFENKTVCTDKTQLDKTKPNIVTCSFGMNIYTTRCFNWISVGIFDEFVWLYDNNGEFIGKFESYKDGDEGIQAEAFTEIKKCRRKHFGEKANNVIYKRIISQFPATDFKYTSHKCIIEFEEPATIPTTYKYIIARESITNKNQPSEEYRSDVMEFTLRPTSYTPKIYQTTDQQGFHWIEYQVWTAAANKIRQKIDFDIKEIKKYNSTLTGAVHEGDSVPNDYIEKVGINAIGDTLTQEEADLYNAKLKKAKGMIIPIVINTGDMTQNGTRYSEWLDYYNGGYEIFKKYEQNNIVGNNDLCGTNPLILGTGDDDGKSNGYYFHIFNCVDVDEGNLPIIDAFTSNNTEKYPSREAKVIPSLYYLNIEYDNNNPTKRMLMINSELTKINCRDWYNLYVFDNSGDTIPNTDDKKGFAVNAYTGFTIVNESTSANYISYEAENLKFRTVYDMLCKMTENSNTKYIAVCHEMPFTVITRDSLLYNETPRYRSLSDKGKLVGSHLNQIDETDIGPGIYWFSRLLEYRNIKVCIGGHKHTYATTYPICENYYWYSESGYNELNNEPKYVWSFLKPIPMAKINNNYVENSNDPNSPINKYSLEWELIIEDNIKRNRVIWNYDETKCEELAYWNGLGQNSSKVNGSLIKKYNTDIGNTHEKTNLSKFPLCFTVGYHSVNGDKRPGTDSDYNYDEVENLYKLYNAFHHQASKKVEYLPVHYVKLITNTDTSIDNEHTYINSDGDLFANLNDEQNVNHPVRNHPVRYFMMQATGYKLKSNKELPSESQRFSNIIPLTGYKSKTKSDSPADDQQRPMFGEITFVKNNNGEEYINLYIIRINDILTDTTEIGKTNFLGAKWMFTQLDYSDSDDIRLECVREFTDGESFTNPEKHWYNSSRSYGVWTTEYQPIISIKI